MKIIDLLNKIANGEDIPKKIKLNDTIFVYQGDDYLYEDKDGHEYWLFSENYTNRYTWLECFLKDEIEIIEEDKKIEKIKVNPPLDTSMYKDYEIPNDYYDYMSIVDIQEKINEIIDKINGD